MFNIKDEKIKSIIRKEKAIASLPIGDYDTYKNFSYKDLDKIEQKLNDIGDKMINFINMRLYFIDKALENQIAKPKKIKVTKENAKNVLSEFFDNEDVEKILKEIKKHFGEEE